jgi:hypothetical protein
VAANSALLIRAGIVHQLAIIEAIGFAVGAIGLGLWLSSLIRYSHINGAAASLAFGPSRTAALRLTCFVLVLSSMNLSVVVFTG